jgi:hypothetical protein
MYRSRYKKPNKTDQIHEKIDDPLCVFRYNDGNFIPTF